MPSDKHNSITAKATGLIFSLFNYCFGPTGAFRHKVSVPIMGHLWMIEYYCTQITHTDLNFGPKIHQLVY